MVNVHLGNIRRNAEKFKTLTGTRLIAVVKADAYGHGAEEVTNALSGVADGFAVALLSEAEQIKVAACDKDILILTPPLLAEEISVAAARNFILTVPDLSTAKQVAAIAKSQRTVARVHLKVNTGMNRYGMNASMLGKVCKFLKAQPSVRVEGVYSHLSGIPETDGEQRRLFLQMQRICKRYFPNVICHLSATHGAALGKEFAFDGVRVGLGLYGYFPNGENALVLEKGMDVCAKTVTNRKYTKGNIGYGKAVFYPDNLTVLRIGYADGVLRKRENGTLDARRNVNNLCMDVCLRAGRIKKGKSVPVWTDASEVAKATGTIVYEVLCAANRRAERVYDNE